MITLYALITVTVLQAGGLMDRASLTEGLSQAQCEAEMRARLDAQRAVGDGLRIYAIACRCRAAEPDVSTHGTADVLYTREDTHAYRQPPADRGHRHRRVHHRPGRRLLQSMGKSWIVYGPQGTGKTLHAPAIAKALGLSRIADEWDGRRNTFALTDTLHLAHDLPEWARENRRVMTIETALERAAKNGLARLKRHNADLSGRTRSA